MFFNKMKPSLRGHCARGTLAVATLLASTAVFAQDDARIPAAEENAGSSDIVVSARRKEESLQEVPIAVAAFSQETLNQRAISNAYDLAKAVPGLVTNSESGNGALPAFSIRGRGQFYGAATGSVETYFAEVPLSSPFQIPGLPPQFFDLQSAQVLKGPQGTLFGRNTTGGAVLFVPQAPTDDFEGYVRGQLGTYSNRQIEGAVNVPLGDIGALRLAGFVWNRDGYTKTVAGRRDFAASLITGTPVLLDSIDINNQDVMQLRGSLRLNPTDNFENTTIVTWASWKNRSATQLLRVRPGTGLATAITNFYGGTIPPVDPRILDTSVDLRRPSSSALGIINTSLLDVTDTLRVKNIFSIIKAQGYTNNPYDVDGSPLPAIDGPLQARKLHNKQIVNELQLQGETGNIDWIVGGMIDLTRQPGANDRMNITTHSFGGANFDDQFREEEQDSHAVFGSLSYKLTDQLTLTAAARHTWDKISLRSYNINDNVTLISVLPTVLDANDTFASGKRKYKGWTYNAGVDYKATDDLLVYAGYRHGYKRGGFNARGAGIGDFAPEKVDDFYAGLKTEFEIGGPGHFNIEGFWDIYKGAQRYSLDLEGGTLVTRILNVEETRYRGFDMDFVLNPTDWLTLSGNYTFVDSKIVKWKDPTVSAALALLATAPQSFRDAFLLRNPIDNNSLADNPAGLVNKHKLSATARFHYEMENGVEVAFQPSMTYQSKFYVDDNSARLTANGEVLFNGGFPVNAIADGANTIPGYTLVDLRLEFNNIADRLDLSFNATNVLDKVYMTGGSGVYQFGTGGVVYGPPQMFFAEARFRF